MFLKNIFFIIIASSYAVGSFAGVSKPASTPSQTANATAATKDTIQPLQITSAWARESMGGSNNSAAYFKIINNSSVDRQIIGVTSYVANTVELHNSFVDEKGVSKMVKLDKLVVPALGSVELKPGGIHIMLLDLKYALKADGAAKESAFKITLHFDDHTIQVVDVNVQKTIDQLQ